MAGPTILRAFETALASGDPRQIRETLLSLDANARAALVALLGKEEVARLTETTRAPVRAAPLGRVVVIHGIMGSNLDAVDSTGETDRIWIHLLRLLQGRMRELRLTREGRAVDPKIRIITAGLHSTYATIISTLGHSWKVLPVAYDWRLNVDLSADHLARQIEGWAGQEPVHIVAHSMGGLVARRMIQRHPTLWSKMADPDKLRRGGRLIMLGTPNHGAFTIPMVLTGTEPLVKTLERVDLSHGMSEMLGIISTFPGVYQMLPSRLVDLGDDHLKLFNRTAWGTFPVKTELLALGDRFARELATVIDVPRMIYVAGVDRATPHRVQIARPGELKYQTTLDGDGRVPHVLGLLAGVKTFYVKEEHGDLPKNKDVLTGMDELLTTGATTTLAKDPPKRRGEDKKWKDGNEIAVPPPIDLFTRGSNLRTAVTNATPAQLARVEGLIVRGFVPAAPEGEPEETPEGEDGTPGRPSRGRTQAEVPSLSVEVVWGGIEHAEADVYGVGHYIGLLPQGAVDVLDGLVSAPKASADERLIRNQVRRRMIRGDVGSVYLYPFADRTSGRLVALAGMGHVGSFGPTQLRTLARALGLSIMNIPDAHTAATVLIGGGALPVPAAAEHLMRGFVEAFADPPSNSALHKLRIVERYRDRATAILRVLRELAKNPEVAERVRLEVVPDLIERDGHHVREEHAVAILLATAAADPERGRLMIESLVDAEYKTALEFALKKITELGGKTGVESAAERVQVSFEQLVAQNAPATRVSFTMSEGFVRTAAITETTTVAERLSKVQPDLLRELAKQMLSPQKDRVLAQSQFLARFIIPPDFRSVFRTDRPLVLEVDRTMAEIPWELLVVEQNDGLQAEPIALSSQVSRQLRTTYSPAPAPPEQKKQALRALVIGDPGDPQEGNDLEGAREEAVRVVEILKKHGVEVTAMIGSPNSEHDQFPPATRIEVLQQLYSGRFDIVHYSGHGDFDENDATRAGWVFQGGMLTAGEMANVDRPPQLIVANACSSARLSGKAAGGGKATSSREASLLPTLADEFFRRGVANYIGTAWPIEDDGAVVFAEKFYSMLLSPRTEAHDNCLGNAVFQARLAVRQAGFALLWGAYQLYGDPSSRLLADAPVEARVKTNGASALKPARTMAELRQLMRDLQVEADSEGMIALYLASTPRMKKDRKVIEMVALAFNRRSASGDREEATRLLESVLDGSTKDAETLGLLGRVYKDRWLSSNDEAALDRAIDAYERGYKADMTAHYPGVNLATLLFQKRDAASKKKLKEVLPKVRRAVEARIEGGKTDYWDFATALELACIGGQLSAARDWGDRALKTEPPRWMIDSTLSNLQLLARRIDAKRADDLKALMGRLSAGRMSERGGRLR